MPTEEETLITRLVVEGEEALEKSSKFRKEIEQIKTQLKELSKQSGQSFDDIASGMKKVRADQIMAATKSIEGMNAGLRALKESLKVAVTEEDRTQQERLSLSIQHTTNEIQRMKSELRDTKKESSEFSSQVGRGLRELNQETKETKEGFKLFGTEIRNVGDIAKLVFGAIFGVTVIGVIRNFIGYLKQAVQSGQEFARSMFLLEVGVRAWQRAGINITIKEVYENIDRLGKRFGIFSKKELVEGSASLLNLTRDLGFTSEQIFKLQESIATLATVNGRAMDDVQRTVALALSSGYTEGLQRLGVAINRVNIAQQALTMGFEGGYTALTEQQRAYASYVLITERVARYEEDLLEYQRTLPGQIDKTTRAIENQSAIIGTQLLPAKRNWLNLQQIFLYDVSKAITTVTLLGLRIQELGNSIMEAFSPLQKLVGFLNKIADSGAIDPFEALIPGLKGLKQELRFLTEGIEVITEEDVALAEERIEEIRLILATDVMKSMLEGTERMGEAQRELLENELRALMSFIGENYDAIGDTMVDSEQAITDSMTQVLEQRIQEIEDMEAQSAERRINIQLDLERDLAAIDRRLAFRISELGIDLQNRMDKIIRDTEYRIQDATARYALDVQQVYDKYYTGVQEAQIKHNQKTEDIEEKYLEKIRKLREDFLFNIEDAIRERDAKQVLRLARRYELDKERAKRERDDALAGEEQRYADELRNLDRQRDERLRRLKEELDLRIDLLKKQRDRELDEARIRTQQQINEEERRAQQQKEERELRFQEEMDDLDRQIEEKAKKLAEAFKEEFGTNQENFDKLYQLAKSYFGENGYLEQVFKYYRQMITNYLAFKTGWNIPEAEPGTASTMEEERKYIKGPARRATGGVDVFTSPTVAKFGEVPEVVTFTPITSSAHLSSVLNEIRGIGGLGGQSQAAVEIFLEPGLTGNIIDNALGETANIIIRKMSSRR